MITPTKRSKTLLVGIMAVVLVAGSFYIASGSILTSSGSIFAAVVTALTGRPTIFIGKDGGSPSGTIKAGVNQPLAIFDISAKNTSNWATLHSGVFKITISSSNVSPINVSNIGASYKYCVPSSVTYGYGWKGGNCSAVTLAPASVVKDGSGYVATFYQDIAIYPQNSYGTITVTGTPAYQYTSSSTRAGASDGTLQVRVSSLSGAGDQCKWSLTNKAAHTYGYTSCVSMNAIINIQSVANTLRVVRPYGYGYLPQPATVTAKASAMIDATSTLPRSTTITGTASGVDLLTVIVYPTNNGDTITYRSNKVAVQNGRWSVALGSLLSSGTAYMVEVHKASLTPSASTLLTTGERK